jgi:predicted nucleic acid-binding protein
MSDKYFLDTNIFVYVLDSENKTKQKKASELIKTTLKNNNGCISIQVIQEFMNVATRKFAVPLTIPECEIYLQAVLSPLCEDFVSIEL